MHPISNRWQEPVFRDFFVEALEHGRALVVSDRRTDAISGPRNFVDLILPMADRWR
ncbi:hypothetical protein CP97_14829 [Aurantiacibacter atlanticus]|uniref:Uncharacterized protein n=1 Tax=Aurantiacibacter atlanticus TaxID=1648404 RepID=A0A168M361_9SPHN|nr:hypothetical protein CP97_14829 [Aurantiacibacter atlanticus]